LLNRSAESILGKELHFTVNSRDIAFINAVLDSYEGLGLMRTIDSNVGHIVIYTAMQNELMKLLESLSEDEGISCHERRGG
jgi:hypothetical protein